MLMENTLSLRASDTTNATDSNYRRPFLCYQCINISIDFVIRSSCMIRIYAKL